MSGEQLGAVKSGACLGAISRPNAGGARFNLGQLREGVIPGSTGEDGFRAFVITDPTSRASEELAIVFDGIDKGIASIGLRSRNKEGQNNHDLLKGAVSVSMRVAGVKLGVLDTASTDLSPEVLLKAGFQQLDEEAFQFALAA